MRAPCATNRRLTRIGTAVRMAASYFASGSSATPELYREECCWLLPCNSCGMNNRDSHTSAWAQPHRADRFCRLHSLSQGDWHWSGDGVDRPKDAGRRIRQGTDNSRGVPCSSHTSSLAFWSVRPDVVQQRPIKVGLAVPCRESPRLVVTADEPKANWLRELRLGAKTPGPERGPGPGSILRGITQRPPGRRGIRRPLIRPRRPAWVRRVMVVMGASRVSPT